MNYGEKIKQARENLGITRKELSKRIGLSPASISGLEAGKMRIVIDNAVKIAEALSIPIEFLLTENSTEISRYLECDKKAKIFFTTYLLLSLEGRASLQKQADFLLDMER